MRVSIEPFESRHEAAAAAFNRRMRDRRAPTAFLLSTRARPPVRSGSVLVTHYVAVDEAGEVRGGMICQEHTAVAEGRSERVVNIQAPLSEGLVDRARALVAPRLIQHALRQTPLGFAVGMGDPSQPLPRLLTGLGWTIRSVPFYFRLIDAGRCVRQLAPFRSSRLRRFAAEAAAASGLADAGARLAHRPDRRARRASSDFELRPVHDWTTWPDDVWEAFAPRVSFAVRRTGDVLPFFYPSGGAGPEAWLLRRGPRVEGWFGLLIAPMRGHPAFGDLRVATLTDCVGSPDAVRAAMVLALQEARVRGADLLITNQLHHLVQECCREAGWRSGPSNFLLATSPALSRRLQDHRSYVTRRDGDGLVHLQGTDRKRVKAELAGAVGAP